jgi:hypothetical protein
MNATDDMLHQMQGTGSTKSSCNKRRATIVGFHKEVCMSDASRAAKMESGGVIKGETGREAVEVAEAIKALQTQLADLRKIVQAAKAPGDNTEPGRRQ